MLRSTLFCRRLENMTGERQEVDGALQTGERRGIVEKDDQSGDAKKGDKYIIFHCNTCTPIYKFAIRCAKQTVSYFNLISRAGEQLAKFWVIETMNTIDISKQSAKRLENVLSSSFILWRLQPRSSLVHRPKCWNCYSFILYLMEKAIAKLLHWILLKLISTLFLLFVKENVNHLHQLLSNTYSFDGWFFFFKTRKRKILASCSAAPVHASRCRRWHYFKNIHPIRRLFVVIFFCTRTSHRREMYTRTREERNSFPSFSGAHYNRNAQFFKIGSLFDSYIARKYV